MITLFVFLLLCVLSIRSLMLLVLERKGWIGRFVDFLLFLFFRALAWLIFTFVRWPAPPFGHALLIFSLVAVLILLSVLWRVRRSHSTRVFFITLKTILFLFVVVVALSVLMMAGFFYVTEDRPVLKITMTGNFRGEWVEWKPPGEPLQQAELNAYEVVLDTPEGKRMGTLYAYGDQIAVKAKVLRFRPILNVMGFPNLCDVQYLYNGYTTAERFNHYPHRAQEIPMTKTPISRFQEKFWNFWEDFYYLRKRSSLVKSATQESAYLPLVDEEGRAFRGSYYLTVTTGGLSSIPVH
ncbi:MAG TPA: hypothetical protein VJ521_05545 [Acidobacteriota bacterium]|nr:hypothetical protein [Acidobacteriota bacterium]